MGSEMCIRDRHDGNLKIKKVFLKPGAKVYPKAAQAIKKADLVVIGPGDLYSSLAQILLVRGIPQALKESKGKKIYICNLMTKHGETNNFGVLDFVREIERYSKTSLDYVVYNNYYPTQKRIANYKKKHSELIEMVKPVENLFSQVGLLEEFSRAASCDISRTWGWDKSSTAPVPTVSRR